MDIIVDWNERMNEHSLNQQTNHFYYKVLLTNLT